MDGLLVRCCEDCAGRNSSFIESPTTPSKLFQAADCEIMDPLAGASIDFKNTSTPAELLRSKVNAPFLLGTELSLKDQETDVESFIGSGVKVKARLGEIHEEEGEEIGSAPKDLNITNKVLPAFSLASLSNDPPILEHGGWHPLSG